MQYKTIHTFPVEEEKKESIQIDLRKQLVTTPYFHSPKIVCGIDLAYKENLAAAVIVAMDHSTHEIVELVYHVEEVMESYVPGMLAFRELPLILKAWEKLTIEPDVVFFDGNGMLHPRRMGIASHASFFLQKPTIGIAKTYLLGDHKPLGLKQGEYEFMEDQGEVIGAIVRTQTGVKPVYVSIGNYLALEDAIRLSMEQVGKISRLPEIVRQADIYSRKILREYMQSPKTI
ncbi:endonuclease V [Shimazuella sp. AN120528]|uniref:endonuclease V n=1 Tax=Shimazuella soli TaxID=1892854 RepID=UPI001F118F87|nr:endonuclease V [Shimazuella soli]MCH5584784.1 endonuclease V [Shimazuella soli]